MHLTKKILFSVALLIGLIVTAHAQSYQYTLSKGGTLAPPQPWTGSGAEIRINTVYSSTGGGSDATGISAIGGSYYVAPYKFSFSPTSETLNINLWFSNVSYCYYYVNIFVDGVLAYKSYLQTYEHLYGDWISTSATFPVTAGTSSVEVRLTNN